ncbi:MAG: hypothetical protein WCG27_02215 [Pseudomonadota bacterium]
MEESILSKVVGGRRKGVERGGEEEKVAIGTGIGEKAEKRKITMDLGQSEWAQKKIEELLEQANQKSYGRRITVRDLVIHALGKVDPSDIQKLQEESMNDMQKIQRMVDEYNKQNSSSLDMGQFLKMKLNMN